MKHTSNDLICGCIASIYFCLYTKEVICNTSHKIYLNLSEFYEYYVIYYMTITYANDKYQLMPYNQYFTCNTDNHSDA